jgi:hypothetical protein
MLSFAHAIRREKALNRKDRDERRYGKGENLKTQRTRRKAAENAEKDAPASVASKIVQATTGATTLETL